MTRTEKLLAELIALPSVNPAFAPSDGASARQARLRQSHYGEKNVADFLAAVAARAGLEIEFQKVDFKRWGETPGEPVFADGSKFDLRSRGRSPHQQMNPIWFAPISSRASCRETTSAGPSCSRRTSTPSARTGRNSSRSARTDAFTAAARATQKVPSPPCSPRFANWQIPNRVRSKRKSSSPD